MHIALPRVSGEHVLMVVIGGVTWLALIGGVLSTSILSDGAPAAGGHSHYQPAYVAYNAGEVVPTDFGALVVTGAEVSPPATEDAETLEVHVTLRVDNNQDAQIDAPRFEDVRLINSQATEARPKARGWSGPAVLIGHSSATVDLTFLAPRNLGLMWLEYRQSAGQSPARIVVGKTPLPQPTAADSLGGAQQ